MNLARTLQDRPISKLLKANATPGVAASSLSLLEVVCLSAVLAVVVAGWLALTLAIFGIYHPVVAFVGGVAAAAVGARQLNRQAHRSLRLADALGLAVPIALSIGLFFPPDEWILGALDPGSYVNAGAAIATTGHLLQYDSLIATMPADLRDVLFLSGRLPGFYMATGHFDGPFLTDFDLSPYLVTPHAFHLYPATLSLGYGLGGIRAELYVTPILAVLGVAAFYLLTRRLFGSVVAAVAGIFLVLGPAEIWFARYPDAEILAQVLLFGGLLAFSAMHDRPSWTVGIVSGLALGAVHLAKIEELPLPIILVGYFGYRILSGNLDRRWLGFLAGYLPLALQAILQAYYLSTWYTMSTFDKSLSPRMVLALIVAVTFLALAFVTVVLNRSLRNRVRAILHHPASDSLVGVIAPALIGILALYAYYIRPLRVPTIQAASATMTQLAATNDAQSFVRLGWYITPLGILLGVIGWMLIARRERRQEVLLPLAVIAVESALYVAHMYITPIHYWAARRWISLVIPGFALAGAYCLNHVFQLRRRWLDAVIPAGLGIVVLIGLVGASRPLFGYVEYRGAIDQLQTLANVFPSNAIVMFADGDAGQRFSVPLQYIYGRASVDVLAGTEPAAGKVAQGWLAEGRPVYWVTTADLADPSAIGAQGTIVARQRISLPEKIATLDTRPGADGLFQQDLIIWRLEPNPADSQTP